MRILIDYRPALRQRSGVGEYVHQLARALAQPIGGSGPDADRVDLFTSSWKDRPDPGSLAELGPVHVVDRRIPVRLLNFLWHRLEAPPIDWLTSRRYDVVHSPHPLLLPARSAARLVTVHDLDFLDHPERTSEEIRRDYPRLAASHARRAEGVIVPSAHVGRLVQSAFGISSDRVSIVPHGVPAWHRPAACPPGNPGGRHLLFLGTLEPRKNVAGLLAAYAALLAGLPDAPPLVLAGRALPAAGPWLGAIARAPLAGRVEYRGYVAGSEREDLIAAARLLVLPSFDEGFGLPALEAMSLGVPVVVSNRGALPEIVGDAGWLVEPEDTSSICHAIAGILADPDRARVLAARGIERAAGFTWKRAAELTRAAYVRAIERRRAAGGQD